MGRRRSISFLAWTGIYTEIVRILPILAHGLELLLPFDLAETTYIVPKMDQIMSTENLIAQGAKMLQKRPQDLKRVRSAVLKARWESVKQLEKSMKKKIQHFDFKPGNLVLFRNSKIDQTRRSHDT